MVNIGKSDPKRQVRTLQPLQTHAVKQLSQVVDAKVLVSLSKQRGRDDMMYRSTEESRNILLENLKLQREKIDRSKPMRSCFDFEIMSAFLNKQ
jgi:hypothetical protein